MFNCFERDIERLTEKSGNNNDIYRGERGKKVIFNPRKIKRKKM